MTRGLCSHCKIIVQILCTEGVSKHVPACALFRTIIQGLVIAQVVPGNFGMDCDFVVFKLFMHFHKFDCSI